MTDAMEPGAEERMDRAHLDHGQWLAKDVDKVLNLIRAAYADGRASRDADVDGIAAEEARIAYNQGHEDGYKEGFRDGTNVVEEP